MDGDNWIDRDGDGDGDGMETRQWQMETVETKQWQME